MSQMSVKRGAIFVLCGFALGAMSCTGGAGEDVTCAREEVVLEEGLRIRDLSCGSGTVAESGMSLTVRFETRLEDGTVVSQPQSEGRYTFRLGAGQVISGWDEGLPGMAVGGTRELVVPPELAYADAGLFPDVPPGATVTFEVELLEASVVESS